MFYSFTACFVPLLFSLSPFPPSSSNRTWTRRQTAWATNGPQIESIPDLRERTNERGEDWRRLRRHVGEKGWWLVGRQSSGRAGRQAGRPVGGALTGCSNSCSCSWMIHTSCFLLLSRNSCRNNHLHAYTWRGGRNGCCVCARRGFPMQIADACIMFSV